MISEFLWLTEFKILGQLDVEFEVLDMGWGDVEWEVFGDLMDQEVREGELEGLTFGSENILFDDSHEFSEWGEVDDVFGLLIKIV